MESLALACVNGPPVTGPRACYLAAPRDPPTAAPCPVLTPRARAAQPAGKAGFPPAARTGALRASRGCATLPLVPPCRSRWSAVVCNASVYIIPLMKQCVSVAAAA